MLELLNLAVLYILAVIGILTVLGIVVVLYLCYRYDININIHGKEIKREIKEKE